MLEIALGVVGVIASFAVLFTGRRPGELRDFARGVGRWWLRVKTYRYSSPTSTPPFTLS